MRGSLLSVNDTSNAPHTSEERAALEAADIRAYIGPLLIKDGRLVGAFGIHSRSPRVWTADEISLVQEVADRIWATLEHRKAEAGLRANEERLAFLLRLNDALRPLSDAEAIQETAARHLGEYLGVNRVGYAEREGSQYIIRREYTRGVEPLVGRPPQITVGPRLGEALQRGETIVVGDVQTDQRLSDDDRATFRARQIAAFVGVPLLKDGQMVAAFGANQNTARVWTAAEIELVREVAERTWDAVERARAEAALREQKTRLGLALEASTGGSWTWDLRTNAADWDDVFRARFGFSPEEPPVFETWLERVHADDRPWMLRTFEEISQWRDTWDHTYRVPGPDGAVRWIQSLGRADRDAAGRLSRLTGLELDVTERRRIEDALQARRDEEHDLALQTLLETATQGIVSADAAGTIVFANRALESMFGWAAEELIGTPVARLVPVDVSRRHERRGRPGPRRHAQGRVHLSDRSLRQSRSDPRRRTRVCVRDRHHRTPACRGGPAGAHDRTGTPDDPTESDGVGSDACGAPCARADRQDAARWAPAAPGHRGLEPRPAVEAGDREVALRRASCSPKRSSSSTKRWSSRGR